MLYLLTYADVSAVNPTAWTQWKAALLQDLYMRTLNYLDKSAQTFEEERARLIAASVRIRNAAEGQFSSEEIDTFLVSMPEQYLLTAATHRVLDHMSMMKKLPEEQLVIRHRHYPERGYTELTVCAYDAYGMFYRTAGTIAAKNLNVLRAQVYTGRNGVMIDTFHITDAEGKLIIYDEVWRSITADLREVLSGVRRPPEPRPSQFDRAVTATVPASVAFDNTVSDEGCFLEFQAFGRLLHLDFQVFDQTGYFFPGGWTFDGF